MHPYLLIDNAIAENTTSFKKTIPIVVNGKKFFFFFNFICLE